MTGVVTIISSNLPVATQNATFRRLLDFLDPF
jgi:hypothetical protein